MPSEGSQPRAPRFAQLVADEGVQRRRVLHRRDTPRAGPCALSTRHAARAVASRMARLPRLPRQLSHDRRRVVGTQRDDRPADPSRLATHAYQLVVASGDCVLAVPHQARRGSHPRHECRTCLRDGLRPHPAHYPAAGLRASTRTPDANTSTQTHKPTRSCGPIATPAFRS